MASADSKEVLRREFLKIRNTLKPEERRYRDTLIRERFLSWEGFKAARTVFFYCSKDSEVDTRILIKEALSRGRRVALPQTSGDGKLQARLIRHFPEDCSVGAFGILEPEAALPAVLKSEIDLFVIPGVAFDLTGARLGWGKGFFDQYLMDVRRPSIKAALAYELQISSSLPAEGHDVRMNVLITEQRILNFGGF